MLQLWQPCSNYLTLHMYTLPYPVSSTASLGFSEPASVSRFTCKHSESHEKNSWWSTPYVLKAWQNIKHVFTRHLVCSDAQCCTWSRTFKLLSEENIRLTVRFPVWEIFSQWYACLSEVSFTFHWHLFSVCCRQASLFGHNDWGVWA